MNEIVIYILVMAGVTYLIRVLPLVLIRGEIHNPFIRSFLYYVPFATLSVMIFPAVLNSTARVESAAVGAAAGAILAFHKGSLVLVAFAACAAAFFVEMIL